MPLLLLRSPLRCAPALALALCLLFVTAVVPCAAQGALPLTEVERDWIAAHPVVRVGVSTEFPPYYFADARGRYEGFVIDLMDRLGTSAGLQMDYRHYPRFGDTLAAIKAGEIELTPFASESAGRNDYLRFVRPLFSTQMVYVADRRLGDVRPDATFTGYRVAVEKASTAADLLRERFPQAVVQEYDSAEQALLATAAGDADVFLGFRQVAVYFMEKHLTANLVLRGSIETPGTALGPAVRKDLTVLASILDKAISHLTTDEIADVASRWLPRSVLGEQVHGRLSLTPAQRAWVKDHGSFRLGFDESFAPIAFTNVAGGFDGMAADITHALAAKIGLIVGFERGGSFGDVFDRASRGELDVVVGAARNAERNRSFEFVGPFLRVPTVVVAASDRDLGVGLEASGARRVALLHQHFLIPQLRSRYPNLVLHEYASQAEVLAALRAGEVDLAIGNMDVVNQLLQQRHVGALRLVGTVPQGDSELYFAVRRDLPELAPILRVALDAMTPAEMAEIEGRWLRLQWTPGIPWARALAIGGGSTAVAVLVLGSLWLGNRRLRAAQRTLAAAHRLAEEQVTARSAFTAYLSHELRGTLGGLSGGLELLAADGMPAERRDRLVDALRGSSTGLLELCERTLDFERSFQAGVDLQPAWWPLADTIARAMTPWRLQAELKGLALQVTVGFDEACQAEFDAVRLTQVLQNLVGNAVKFTEAGRVELLARIDASPQGDALRLVVIDTGPGIPEAERDRLFVPFAQGGAGRVARRGAGLGLSITARIVDAMGGSVRIDPSATLGTTFEVRVPMVFRRG